MGAATVYVRLTGSLDADAHPQALATVVQHLPPALGLGETDVRAHLQLAMEEHRQVSRDASIPDRDNPQCPRSESGPI